MAIKEINVENGFTSDEAIVTLSKFYLTVKRRVFTLFTDMAAVEKVELSVKK